MMSKRIAVAILNWNGRKWLEQFLPNVIEHSCSMADVVLIDNGSTDDSIAFCETHFPDVTIVSLDQNHGFAGGYNEGLKELQHEYFVLLNSDIEVTPHWLQSPIEWLDRDPLLAACQPKILSYQQKDEFEYAGACGGYLDQDGYAFCKGRIFFSYEQDQGQYKGQHEVFWATGAALIIKSKAWREVSGLDADFFAHMEEIDLCWRLKNRGYKIGADLESSVYHVGGGTLDRLNPNKTFLNFRNNLLLLTKNYTASPLFMKILKRMLLDGIAGVRFLTEGKWLHCWAIVRAHWQYDLMLFSTLRKRRAERPYHRNPNAVGWYQKSILLAFFMQGKTCFHQLDSASFVQCSQVNHVPDLEK
jgi:GT2 family glycosyltransferase